MKKFFMAILCILYLFGTMAGLAETQTAIEQFTLMGIPWGVGVEEATAFVKDNYDIGFDEIIDNESQYSLIANKDIEFYGQPATSLRFDFFPLDTKELAYIYVGFHSSNDETLSLLEMQELIDSVCSTINKEYGIPMGGTMELDGGERYLLPTQNGVPDVFMLGEISSDTGKEIPFQLNYRNLRLSGTVLALNDHYSCGLTFLGYNDAMNMFSILEDQYLNNVYPEYAK